MNRAQAGSAAGGLGFVGALTLLFIALKLTHVIDWGWEWVLSPLWLSCIGTMIVVVVAVVMFVVAATFIDAVKGRRR